MKVTKKILWHTRIPKYRLNSFKSCMIIFKIHKTVIHFNKGNIYYHNIYHMFLLCLIFSLFFVSLQRGTGTKANILSRNSADTTEMHIYQNILVSNGNQILFIFLYKYYIKLNLVLICYRLNATDKSIMSAIQR